MAREALRLLMLYAVRTLRLRRFVAKIGEGNAASLKLFQYLVSRRPGSGLGDLTVDVPFACSEEYLRHPLPFGG